METSYNGFIGVYDNVFPEDFCNHLINGFDYREKTCAGSVRSRQGSENNVSRHVKEDVALNFNLNAPDSVLPHYNNNSVFDVFFRGLQFGFIEYVDKFSILREQSLVAADMKLQRTAPGAGYHQWHYESTGGLFKNRVLSYMLYLKTLGPEGGGETEFLYQKLRVAPEENKLLIWPADYTHTHRGNMVLGEKHKYIATGWFTYNGVL